MSDKYHAVPEVKENYKVAVDIRKELMKLIQRKISFSSRSILFLNSVKPWCPRYFFDISFYFSCQIINRCYSFYCSQYIFIPSFKNHFKHTHCWYICTRNIVSWWANMQQLGAQTTRKHLGQSERNQLKRFLGPRR